MTSSATIPEKPKGATQVYNNYIGGQWLKPKHGKTFTSINPADTSDIVGHFASSTTEDVHAAVEAAKQAYTGWRKTPAPHRADILLNAARLLQERKEELARLMVREMGKVIKEARGDVQEAIDMAYYISGEGRRMFGQTVPSELRDKFAMSVRAPIGVVGLITPWNFPIAIPGWKIFPALLCGNAVVFKPATDTPLCALMLVKALEDAGLPAGVLNFVTGSGGQVGTPLIEHPDVRMISVTGSSEVGRKIAGRCGELMKRVSCELGGKNAICVMEDADIELAVEGALWGAFGTAGQRCTAASRIIVHRKIYREFLDIFATRTKALRLGNGLDPNVDVGPVINESQLKQINRYTEIGVSEGAQLVCGGHIAKGGGKEHDLERGFFFEPTIFADAKPDMRISQEEIFGPVTTVISISNYNEAIKVANGTQYGLSLSMYTQDVNQAFRAMDDLESGIVYINAPTIGAEIHLPFGGIKQTGNGHREAGTTAIDQYSEWKSIFVDYSGKLQKAQIDLHDAGK